MATRRPWWLKLLLGLLTAALLLVIVEVVLRISTEELGRASIPAWQVTAHVESEGLSYDPVYGWVRTELPDRHGHVDINGFRHVEDLEKKKQPGAWRAFTMGDSQTYGAGVDADETYSHYAEAALRAAAPDRRVEVINAALSGYGSLQALRLIQNKLLDWDPDLLIVDCRAYDQPRDGLTPRGQLTTVQRLLFHYRTYYVVRFFVERARGDVRPMAPPPTDGRNIPGGGNHDVIMQVAQAAGVPVIFLDYPFYDTQHRHAGMQIQCLAAPRDLPPGAVVVSICGALAQSGHPYDDLFLDNNHLTELGNRVAGQALAEGIQSLGLGP